MGDLSIESFWACESERYYREEVKSSDGSKTYDVKFDEQFGPNKNYQYDWSCSCPAFKFGGGKHCKHILQVKNSGHRCGWNQHIDGGEPNKTVSGEDCCPRCGGEIFAFRAGV